MEFFVIVKMWPNIYSYKDRYYFKKIDQDSSSTTSTVVFDCCYGT